MPRSGVIKKLVERPDSAWFRVPVARNLYPDYYVKITVPVDLRTMEERNLKFE